MNTKSFSEQLNELPAPSVKYDPLPVGPGMFPHGMGETIHPSWKNAPFAPEPPDSMNPKDKLGLKKPAMRLVPWVAVLWMAKVFTFGAKKYSEFNWRKKKVRSSVYDEAALRHIIAVMDGQDLDEETGLPHEAHVMACMAIKLDARACGVLVDDRNPSGNVASLINLLTEKDEARKAWLAEPIPVVDTSKDDVPF